MTRDKQKEKINSCIQDLVYDKIQLKKAYNYYHGMRDADQFRHIEENYGIGTPTAMSFTPLVRKHIDVLVGEYLELEPELQITCKDDSTLSNILNDKKLKIDAEVHNHLSKYLTNSLLSIFSDDKKPFNDPFIEDRINNLRNDLDKSFVSDYELAAINILDYLRTSRNIDLKNKMRELFTDLLISGTCYFKTKSNPEGDNVELMILDPLNTYIERTANTFYLNKSQRSVVRRWMNKNEILKEYGDLLSTKDIELLDSTTKMTNNKTSSYFVRYTNVTDTGDYYGLPRQQLNTGVLGGLEVTPTLPWNNNHSVINTNKSLFEVFEVEWIEYNIKHKRMDRYEGVKIGSEIYITKGVSENGSDLSVNGMFFLDKNGVPFSIMLTTMDLQDKYDLAIFYRDNLLANSGTSGDWLDIAHLPTVLGDEFVDRAARWQAYKKNGVAWFDSSQTGSAMLNTTFQGFDDTVKPGGIQAIQLAKESIEMEVASITGVFPEKLGGIQQRDAVSNVKVGIKYSTLLTKQYFNAMDLMLKEVNYDLLNLSKIVFKNGLTGTILLGDKQSKIFTALPQHFTVTDYDIHIEDSTENLQARESIKALNIELIKGGFADPEMIIDIATSKSLTQLKRNVSDSMKIKKAENSQLQQMQSQIQEYDNSVKQLQEQLRQLGEQNKQLESALKKSNEEKLKIEHKKLAIEEEKVSNNNEFNDRTIKLKEKQLELELLQLDDSNPYNNEIKNGI